MATVPVAGSRRRRKLRSSVWQFFSEVETRESGRCRLCGVIMRTTGGSTSSLIRHMASHHGGYGGGRSLESLRMELAKQKETGNGDGGGTGGGKKFREVIPLDKTGPKPTRQLSSPAWEFFTSVVFKKTARCKLCEAVISAPRGSTTALVRHLRSKHKDYTENLEELRSLLEKKEEEKGEAVAEDIGGATSEDPVGLQPRKQLTSPMWKFFTPVVLKETARCNLCQSLIGTHRGSTTGLVRHMRSKHGGGLSGIRKELALNRKANKAGVKMDLDGDEDIPEDQKKTLVDGVGVWKPKRPWRHFTTVDGSGVRRRSRRLFSPTWEFFAVVVLKHSAKCKICGVVLRTPHGSTSSMARHLEAKHGGDLKSRRREMFLARQQNSPRERPKVIKIELDEDTDHDQEDQVDEEKGEPQAKKLDGNRDRREWGDTSRVQKRTAQEKVESDMSEEDDAEETADISIVECESSDDEFRMDDPLQESGQEGDESAPRPKSKVMPSTGRKAKEACFVCHEKFSNPSVSQLSEKEYHFFFKEMLEIPTGKTMDYLEQLERPEKWIGLCNACQSLIGESLSAKRKIISLQLEIENYQRKVLKKLKANRGTEFTDYPKKQRRAVKGIKDFVKEKHYSVLDSEEDLCHNSDTEQGPDEDPHSPQALYCGLCDDDTVYETAAQLTTHTKEAHTSFTSIETENVEDRLHDPVISELDELFPKRISGQSPQCKRYRYDCPNCPDIRGYTVTQFVQHLFIHRRRPYQCTICSAFLSEDTAAQENHWKENHSDIEHPPTADKFVQIKFSPGKIWNCESCLTGFFSEEDRDHHELRCLSPTKLRNRNSLPLTTYKSHQCQLCDGLRFRDFSEWRFHRALHHPEVDSMSCYYCDESFRETTLEGVEARHDLKMVDHMHTEHGTMKLLLECDPCGLVFEPGIEITRHMSEKHGTPANKVYPCSFCDMSYGDIRGIRTHMAHVHFERHSSICETCGATFLAPISLDHHIFRAHGTVPEGHEVLPCPEEGCSYKTIILGKLNIHMDQVHEAQGRPHVCSSCGKGFTTGAYLRQHEDTHKNKETRPFQCETCGASFAIKYYLNVHRKAQHEGKKTKDDRRRTRTPVNPEMDVAGTSRDSESSAPSTSSSAAYVQPEGHQILNL